jgi:hypothetical protein
LPVFSGTSGTGILPVSENADQIVALESEFNKAGHGQDARATRCTSSR